MAQAPPAPDPDLPPSAGRKPAAPVPVAAQTGSLTGGPEAPLPDGPLWEDAESILRRYLDEKLAELGSQRAAAETLLEEHLVDLQGNRKILTEAEARAALPDFAATAVLQQLENAAVLRAEAHHGGRYFELGHDWLAKKVFENKTARRQKRKEEEERALLRRARFRLLRLTITAVLVALVLAVLLSWSWGQHEAAHDALAIEGARELVARDQWEDAASLLLATDTPGERAQWLDVALSVANRSPLERVLRGHEDKLTSAVWSPDGTQAVTTSLDRTARVWDLTGTRPPIELRAHNGPVLGAAWSPDGRRIVTASADGTARVWELDGSGKSFALACAGEVRAATFSPDGRRVLTASEAGARVWELDGSRESFALGPPRPVRAAAWSPDGARAATADDTSIGVWELQGPVESARLGRGRAYPDVVGSLSFSPDGSRLLALYSVDHTAQVWKLDGSRGFTALETPGGPLLSAAFSPDGQRVVTAAESVQVWKLGATPERIDLATGGHRASFASFSPDGRSVVAACEDGIAWVWDIGSPEKASRLQGRVQGFHDRLSFASFSPDGARVLTASDNGNAQVWTLAGHQGFGDLIGHTEAVESAAFSPDGRRVLTGSDDGTARLWDLDGSGRFVEIKGGRRITSAVFSPDGNRAVVTSASGSFVWDLHGGKSPVGSDSHSSLDADPAWSPDGRSLLTFAGGTVRLWDIASHREVLAIGAGAAAFDAAGNLLVVDGGQIRRLVRNGMLLDRARLLEGRDLRIDLAAFSRDRKRMLLLTDEGLRVWELDGSGLSQSLGRPAGDIHLAWLDPAGQHAVTVSSDEIRIWDLDGSRRSLALKRKDHVVLSAAQSPDGQRIAAAYEDGAVVVWRATPEGANDPTVVLAHKQAIRSIAWSPDGQRLLTASNDHTARVFTDVPALLAQFRAVSVRCISRELRRKYLAETAPEAWVRHLLCEHRP